MDPSRIAILTPSYDGAFDPEYLAACRRLKGVAQIRPVGMSAVDAARAMCATLALEDTSADVLFWIDSDIVFDPEDVWRLSELCVDGYPIIGGAYAKKKPGGGIVASFLPDTPQVVRFFEGGDVMEVGGLGFGFLAIHRKVFEALAEQFPLVHLTERKVRGWFLPDTHDGKYRSEDYAFLGRARDAGFRVWLDTTVRLYHKGVYAYKLEDTGQVIPDAQQLNLTVSVPQGDFAQALLLAESLGASGRTLERIADARRECLSDGVLYPVDDMAAAFLAVRAQGFERVGEAGSGTGYSAACLAAGGAGVVSFDENDEWQDKAKTNVARLSWGNRIAFAKMSPDAEFSQLDDPFELFLIDSTDETRFKVLPNLVEDGLVNEKTEIYIHDAFRPGERAILDNWVKLFPGSHWEMSLELGRGVARFHLSIGDTP